MLTDETINEMVRIIREYGRMCDTHDDCNGCRAEHINTCGFYAAHEDLAELMQIVDAWNTEHPEKEQQEETGNEQMEEI